LMCCTKRFDKEMMEKKFDQAEEDLKQVKSRIRNLKEELEYYNNIKESRLENEMKYYSFN